MHSISLDPLAKTYPMTPAEWEDLLKRQQRSLKRLQRHKRGARPKQEATALHWRTAALGIQLPHSA